MWRPGGLIIGLGLVLALLPSARATGRRPEAAPLAAREAEFAVRLAAVEQALAARPAP